MVGHRLLELLIQHGANQAFDIVTFCEEPRIVYDRVHLSDYFRGKTAADLALAEEDYYDSNGIQVYVGDRVEWIDRDRQCVHSREGLRIEYTKLVLATGSRPFVPPIIGSNATGCFVYRTIEDLRAIDAYANDCSSGLVVGGGLLGLEAADALVRLGLDTHVVEFAPQLMGAQLDAEGGGVLQALVENLGIHVHTSRSISAVTQDNERVTGVEFADGSSIETEMIVFSAGIRPRDELARACGLRLFERGGVEIDDHCRTSDASIYAVGEVAAWRGRTYGLVAPGYAMAAAAANHILGRPDEGFQGAEMAAKLKLLGVDVASFGDTHERTAGCNRFSFTDQVTGIHRKLVVDADAGKLLGGVFVGDLSNYTELLQAYRNDLELPENIRQLAMPTTDDAPPLLGGPGSLLDSAQICSCVNVDKGMIRSAVRSGKTSLAQVKSCTKAGTGCGACLPLVGEIVKLELADMGVDVNSALCEHFEQSRQDLHNIVLVKRIETFDALLAECGKGHGCEVCKPTVAGILASCWNRHVLDDDLVGLQDTNDRFLANIQKDGTYSVIPRVPGGEITPAMLMVLGQVGQDYDLYTKITGGQRVGLFGARADQLPDIWRILVAAGFESGHAYGKALRTVKTCVGSSWCRYGMQDSVGFGIFLENRYKGLRAPHKIKIAVSGCARECAEAQCKDIGVVATEQGYDLYLCGNGGMTPRHGDLFARDLDERTLVRYVDRFLMFYVRTADRLQRTARWLENLEGGLDYLREVIVDDSLGLCAEFEDQMSHVTGTFQCEWKSVLDNPKKLGRFKAYLNSEEPREGNEYVRERGQRRPAVGQ